MEDLIINVDPLYGITPTKELILNKIQEEQIFMHYGVPVQRGLFCSKLRGDNNPTVCLYRNKAGRLMYKDFAEQGTLDCFAYVSRLYNVSYSEALYIIANDFGLIKTPKKAINKPVFEYKGEKIVESPGAIIKCEIQPFTAEELAWWAQYGISERTLRFYNIYSIKNMWLNGNLTHIYNPLQMVYGYYGGKIDNVEKWRIYFPATKYRQKKTFINNWPGTMVQGWNQLPKKGDVVFVQKAMKDCMAMYELGYAACAPTSENTPLSEEALTELKSRFSRIIYFGDNDDPGLRMLESMKEKHPELEYYHLPVNEEKDLSDYIKVHGKESAKELIQREFFEEEW